ncbi:MAG: M14 family metallopeptidase, partial [Candidatus Thermoplasmatota archaeon]|nr:M14 family metallopeptidase [Candidatus Thermoplasmatota archaeon]
MRWLLGLLVLSLLAAPAAGEWGAYGDDGFPLNVHGASTYPGPQPPGTGQVLEESPPVNQVGPATLYPYYPLLTAEVQRLADEHPDLVKLHSAGKSVLGLDLWMLEIANFDEIEAGEGIPLEQREVVWVDGATHSNEYSAAYFVLHLASFLTDGYGENETATWIVDNRRTWIMPMVNPDGSHAFGRLNAHGVNINRNYPVDWGEVDESPVFNNPGPAPASEPETRINMDWFNETRPDYYASVHCCGNLWLYPYGVEGWDPVDKEVFERVCDEAFPSVREDCGPIWSTIYPASGSSVDTVYQYTGAVGFGYEMSGRGAVALWGQPFTTEEVREQEHESWQGLMHAFENVHLYGAFPAIQEASMDDERIRITVENQGYGNMTQGEVHLAAADGSKFGVPLPALAPGERATVSLPAVEPGQA